MKQPKQSIPSVGTRDWSLPDTVYLNPEKISEEAETAVEETAVS